MAAVLNDCHGPSSTLEIWSSRRLRNLCVAASRARTLVSGRRVSTKPCRPPAGAAAGEGPKRKKGAPVARSTKPQWWFQTPASPAQQRRQGNVAAHRPGQENRSDKDGGLVRRLAGEKLRPCWGCAFLGRELQTEEKQSSSAIQNLLSNHRIGRVPIRGQLCVNPLVVAFTSQMVHCRGQAWIGRLEGPRRTAATWDLNLQVAVQPLR